MNTEIRLEIAGFRIDREKAIRDALDRLAPGITEGWLTYTLHGGGTASASIVTTTDDPTPGDLAARLVAAVVSADPAAAAHIGAIETPAVRRERSA